MSAIFCNFSMSFLQIKNILKEFATTAVETVGLKHRERRSFVLAEVKNLLHIARSLPGMLCMHFDFLFRFIS